jgi:hypothetical protein
MKVDYDSESLNGGFNVSRVMLQLQQQLDDIPPPPPDSRATHVLITGATKCHVTCANVRAVTRCRSAAPHRVLYIAGKYVRPALPSLCFATSNGPSLIVFL